MAQHNELGKKGEQEAVNYLLQHGYIIHHQNWHCGRKEIDIVAQTSEVLVFVEVKTRKNNLFGTPEDAITNTKIRRIVAAADAYLRRFKLDNPVRFDLITLVGESPNFSIEHIESAFFPPIW